MLIRHKKNQFDTFKVYKGDKNHLINQDQHKAYIQQKSRNHQP